MVKAAELLLKYLEAQGVQYVFGISGAKIDAVFDALQDFCCLGRNIRCV